MMFNSLIDLTETLTAAVAGMLTIAGGELQLQVLLFSLADQPTSAIFAICCYCYC